MLVIVSPAKKLDFENSSPFEEHTTPSFLPKSKALINDLRKLSTSEVGKLMKLSDKLAELNVKRYKDFKTPFTKKNAKQALFAFQGDTYVGFDAKTLTKSSYNYANKHMRILSGLYGALAPSDLIMPYRLEMGTKFGSKGAKNLYEFWGDDITDELNKILKKEKFLVNLASKEYFSVVDFKKINGQVITPVFKEKKGDTYKVVGIFAKRARGMMSRFIVDNKVKTIDELTKFNVDGYKFSKKDSTDTELVFKR